MCMHYLVGLLAQIFDLSSLCAHTPNMKCIRAQSLKGDSFLPGLEAGTNYN